jgi:hypothetical protein
LAAVVLEVAGGIEHRPDDRMGEFVEDEQVGLELADFVFDFLFVELALAADAVEKLPAGTVGDGGRVAGSAAADEQADDAAVDRQVRG